MTNEIQKVNGGTGVPQSDIRVFGYGAEGRKFESHMAGQNWKTHPVNQTANRYLTIHYALRVIVKGYGKI